MNLFTIHGIRARNKWFRLLGTFAEFPENGIRVIPFDYGYFNLAQFMIPNCRATVLSKFLNFYALNRDPNRRPCAICHSFGTFILMKAIKKYPEVVFDKVILFGSILNPETDLEIFFCHNQVNEILHEIGNSDSAVKWSRWVLGDEAGNSGEIGFKFIPAELRHRIKEVPYTDFEHGSADFCLHMQQAWVPFLIKPKFLYDAAILRPDILNYIYKEQAPSDLVVERAEFYARIDAEGRYYGDYCVEGLNKAHQGVSAFPVSFTVFPQRAKMALGMLNGSGFAGGCLRNWFKNSLLQVGRFFQSGRDAVP